MHVDRGWSAGLKLSGYKWTGPKLAIVPGTNQQMQSNYSQ